MPGKNMTGRYPVFPTFRKKRTALLVCRVNATRKISRPLTLASARGVIQNYLAWHVELNEPSVILLASEIGEINLLSFWDALIVAAASRARADRILSEDLSDGEVIEGILIENPFL